MLNQPPSTYMKSLVMMDLVETLCTEHSQQSHFFSRLQRTKLPSRKPTQDCNLFDIGCETFLHKLINVCNNSSCSYFCFMFRKSGDKCQKVQKLDDFCYFFFFNRGVLCQDIGKISWNFGSIFFCVVSKKYNLARQ